jgi:uncharacterized membrane protein
MRPLSVVTLIILGSSFAITFSLAAVIFVVLVLGDEYPRLASEFDALLKSLILFIGMTAVAAASFYSLARNHAARYWLNAAMWLALVGVGYYYWP